MRDMAPALSDFPLLPQTSLVDEEVNHRILIVDDNLAIHNDFRKILTADSALADFNALDDAFFGTPATPSQVPGFTLHFASQGSQALAMVTAAIQARTPYALVFMDVRMPPGWDGIETTAKLWDVDPDLQVVICTAYSDYSWEKMIARLGNSDQLLILKKPFDTIEVFQIAHALTTKWSLQQVARRHAGFLTRAVKERTAELELEMAVRKRSEEALEFTQFSVDHASDAMFWVAPDSRLIYANAAICKSLGYSAGELHDLSAIDIVLEIREIGWTPFWESLRQEKHRTLETHHLTKDGRRIPIELTVNFFDFGGREYICASARDVTRRLKILDELADARDAALESSRQKSQFLANMSHEIRTPMNGVIGMGELLLQTNLDRDQREYVDAIRSSADHLLEIINDILDSSKIDSGQMKFDNIRFELRELVESTLDVVAPAARGKGLELAGCVPPDGCNALCGDAGRLKQVLSNLLGNAVKFTDHGEVTLTVTPLEESTEAVSLRFSIQDTGIGIDPEAHQRIFEPFHQADSSNTRKHGGTGLGLTICRQIVGALGGTLGVDSTPGVGSEFWFILRFEKSGSPSKPIADAMADLRILVVDDNPTNRTILQLQLANLRMFPDAVAGGQEALDFLRAEAAAGTPVPLAIIDMQMPGMDGITLARRIKADPLIASVRLIMLSSLGDHLTTQELREAGVEQHIVKPMKQTRLHAALTSILAGPPEDAACAVDPPEIPAPNTVRVLLVEDNPVNQKVALLQLKRLGYNADLATDGYEALAALERVPYAVILMDCQMPVMDGYEATRRVRRLYQRPIIIIAMTANAMTGDRAKCLEAGMDEHLAKPVRLDDLKRVLDLWIEPPAGSTPAAPPVDLARLNEITDSDPAMFRRIANDYLVQAEEILTLISLAIEKRDRPGIHHLAHKLGGSSASCGITALVEPLSRLEHMGEAFQPLIARDLHQQASNQLVQVRHFLIAHHQSLTAAT